MAEINLERKRSSTGAGVIVAVLVIMLALWWMVASDTPDDVISIGPDSVVGETATATATGTVVFDDVPPAVETFLAWSDETRADSAMTLDHQYTVTGIRNLAAALEAPRSPCVPTGSSSTSAPRLASSSIVQRLRSGAWLANADGTPHET
jgi:hypothetical protein